MNILPRIASTHWRLVRKIVTRTVQQRLASGAIIPKNSVVKHTDKDSIPDNVVILGVELDEVESCRKLRHLPPVPDDCEIIRKPRDCPQHRVPPRIWLDSFESVEFTPTTALELHPEVFGCNPRIDYLNQCKEWQKNFKEVDYTWEPTRAEVGFGKKKPWPQKGLGRARHGSTNAPQWKGGGVAHGHRGPKTLYQKILPHVRLGALTSALTIKLHQNNLSVVNDFSIPSPDKEGLHEILAARNMVENSVLLVYSDNENFEDSINIFSAVEYWPEVNLMPLVALNVWSLLHHDLLVITRAALDELEEKVVWNLHRYNWIDKPHNFYRDLPFTVKHSLTET